MALPKLGYPTFELELPSTGKTIKYRPFLVKEEKVLLLALESKDEKQVIGAVKDLIKNCVITRIKVDTLPSFDLEYLFLQVRTKSVGETAKVPLMCMAEDCDGDVAWLLQPASGASATSMDALACGEPLDVGRWAYPASWDNLLTMKNLVPEDAVWSAFGISSTEFPMVAAAAISGGNVRVGLEDNLYMSRGELASGNAALVARAVTIIEAVGGQVANVEDARQALNL